MGMYLLEKHAELLAHLRCTEMAQATDNVREATFGFVGVARFHHVTHTLQFLLKFPVILVHGYQLHTVRRKLAVLVVNLKRKLVLLPFVFFLFVTLQAPSLLVDEGVFPAVVPHLPEQKGEHKQ